MTREIKFRAWDPTKRKMFTDFYVNHFGGVSYWNPKRGVLSEADDCPVMQFTGLKDKNNKEIYEGDIITHLNRVGAVRWDETGQWACNWNDIAWNWRLSGFNTKEVEVIGNIYENPELLDK